jgi:hypothetical protein
MDWFHFAWAEMYSRLIGATTGWKRHRRCVLWAFPTLFYSIYFFTKHITIISTDQKLECVIHFKSQPLPVFFFHLLNGAFLKQSWKAMAITYLLQTTLNRNCISHRPTCSDFIIISFKHTNSMRIWYKMSHPSVSQVCLKFINSQCTAPVYSHFFWSVCRM